MPHYDYVCASCEYTQEVFQKITENALEQCPKCFQPTFKRKPGAGSGLLFRGNGFYETDYKSSKPGKVNEKGSSPSCCSCNKTGCH